MLASAQGYYEDVVGTFPFGIPLRRTPPQTPSEPTRALIVGVYPSALHATWLGPEGKVRCRAMAVGTEPHSFWNGRDAGARLQEIQECVPERLGNLELPRGNYNGCSGQTLESDYLVPLQLKHEECWVTDLHDTYFVSPGNAKTITKQYTQHAAQVEGMPPVRFPEKPRLDRPTEARLHTLKNEFKQAAPEWVITLGNDPIGPIFDGHSGPLDLQRYGKPFEAEVFGRRVKALCLCHPRQAARLGLSSRRWFDAHGLWRGEVEARGGLAQLWP